MKNYACFYQKIQTFLQKHPSLLTFVICFNRYITRFMYAFYPLLLLYLAFQKAWSQCLACLLIPGISFLLLSFVRKKINCARPYEEWDIVPLITARKKGHSMPSRHVFSATLISMCTLRLQWQLGLVLLLCSLLLALCRVAVGVHYPKDVAVGFILACLLGSLLFLF